MTLAKLRRPALVAALALMAAAAAARWPHELPRGLFLHGTGSHDLLLRAREVDAWFAGAAFAVEGSGTYPPGSYPILWLGVGWLPFGAAATLWGILNLALLAGLAGLAIRASGTRDPLERACVAAFLFTSSSPLVTIGNGQLTIVVVAALLASVLAAHAAPTPGRIALAALAMLVALVKPNLSAPFFWLLLFGATSLAPAVLTIAGYAALTLFAARFQAGTLGELFARWAATSAWQAGRWVYVDLPEALRQLGLWRWALPASLALLAGAGVWSWRHRRIDLWLQLGVVAIVARFWATHRVYDDLLVTIAMIALLRAARDDGQPAAWRRAAFGLLAANVLVQLAPVTPAAAPGAAGTLLRLAFAATWIATGALLARFATRALDTDLDRRG